MAIELNYRLNDKSVCIDTVHNNIKDLEAIEDVYYKICSSLFLDKPVVLITIQPKSYSFAAGMLNSYKLDIDGTELLIAEVESCKEEFLEEVVKSEEFRRGLLVIVRGGGHLLEMHIREILTILKGDQVKFGLSSYEFAFCENDGSSICFYNMPTSVESIQSLLK